MGGGWGKIVGTTGDDLAPAMLQKLFSHRHMHLGPSGIV